MDIGQLGAASTQSDLGAYYPVRSGNRLVVYARRDVESAMHAGAMMDFPRSQTPLPVAGSNVRVAFGLGNLSQLGSITKTEGASRVLLVSDAGIVAAGHVERAVRSLYRAGLAVRVFDGVEENPTTLHVTRGLRVAADFKPDFVIGLGGGSSMDCAKGINFLLTNGGQMQDYWGTDKATKPLLPFIAVPTTAGTGSDAQSFALITDPQTHQKMACGDKKALPRVALLDAELTATQPPKVAAATGIDAIAHAVETAGSKRRNETSLRLSRQAWNLLESSYERSMRDPTNVEARERMLLGSHLAGAAIENSMLGAAHAAANALTAICGTVHGVAVGLMLPHVIRFNSVEDNQPYQSLVKDANDLARRIESLLDAGSLPHRLKQIGADESLIPELSGIAAKQWTATFNPRSVAEADFVEIFRSAMD